MNFRSEKFLVLIFLSVVTIVYFAVALFSESPYDTGDGIQHYLISRYSWKHPELFLHHWGKPFFILISSPFTQFGLFGATVFNICCAIFSAFFCYKISEKSALKLPLFVILFLCFTPVYFGVVQSGLTEPFFGLVLIFCIYLFLEKKIFFASVLVSFLPFIRSEGNLILPLFFILLIYRKKYFFTPFLTLGTIIYSVVGYFFYDDLFWLIHQNPYKGATELYGRGEWYHFILRSEFIWGLPVFLLLIAGFVWLLIREKQSNSFFPEEIILIYGSFTVYFIAHTIFWWKGLFGSMGLVRVMAAIMPVSAFISLRGLNLIIPFFSNKKAEKNFFYLLVFFVPAICFAHYYFSLQTKKEETVLIKEATGWLKQSEHKKQKIYYLHPLVTNELELDRFDRNTNGELWSIHSENPEINLNPGNILFWDSHFGPNEGKIKLNQLINNSSFELLKKYHVEKRFAAQDKEFEIYIFKRR